MNELKYRVVETTAAERNKEKRMKRNEDSLTDLWNNIRSKRLLISWLQLQSTVILEPKKIKSVSVSIVSPSICHEVMGPDAMTFIFWMLNFKPVFSLSSFTFINRPFSSSSLSAIRVVSSAYLRLLIFFPAILILACASSSPAFHNMYSTYKLNKQGDNIQPWHTPFPIWN